MANCDRKDCRGHGAWMPVLNITVKGYRGPPAQAIVNLRICDTCRPKLTVADFVSDEGWVMICAGFRAQGKATPTRKLTKLTWQKIPDPDAN